MQFALGTVTLLALLMTIAMGVVTWRLVREERRRSAARLAALAATLGQRESSASQPSSPASHHTGPAVAVDVVIASPIQTVEDAPSGQPPLSTESVTDLFSMSTGPTEGWGRRLAGVGVAGALLAVLVSVAIFSVSTGSENAEAAKDPVELLSLAHDQQDGMLAISGTVRDLTDRSDAGTLSVLAMAFDDEGQMVASGRAPIEKPALSVGGESSFVVSIPAEQASRYRISFLVDDTTVPHLDRRDEVAESETQS